MNEANIRRWVDALRSGEFRQGTGALHTREGDKDLYCCLGVACDLARADGALVDPKWRYRAIDKMAYYGETGEGHLLPAEAAVWLGFDPDLDDVALRYEEHGPDDPTEGSSHEASAAELNDNGWDFGDIAQAIEDYYLEGKTR